MEHGHDHNPRHDHQARVHPDSRRQNRRRLLAAAGVACLVLVAEVIGGLLANSLALLADSGHVLIDLGSLLLSLLAMGLAERPPSARKTFGYRHAETIAALLNGVTVVLLSLWIIWEALLRLRSPQQVRGELMLVATLIGLAGNLLAAGLLYRGQESSINLRGAFLHVVGDILGSLAALVAAAGIFLFHTTVLDPLASIVVAVLILTSAWELLGRSSSLLMLSVPSHLPYENVQASLLEVPGVTRVHDLHVWSVGEGTAVLTCHLVVEEPIDRQQVLAAAQSLLSHRFAISHSVIQIESGHIACPAELSCFVPPMQ
jgi:cobalt-zinc-cadmium efflux system protein